jgi:RimJ/RimL family protein N-acetyltransferase
MLVSAEDDPRGSGTIWTMELAAPAPEVSTRLPATFRRAGPETLSQLAGASEGVPAEMFRKRFDTDRRCYGAWIDGQLAAYGWISLEEEWIGELRLRLRLGPGEAYIWDCFTAPPFRQRYLYTALLTHIVTELRMERLKRVWIGTNAENLASQRGIARAGFQPVAHISVERALAVRMVWVQGLPGVPENLVAAARRVFLSDRERVWLDAPAVAAAYCQQG